MPEHHIPPFAQYLQEVDAMLKSLPMQQREEIRQELIAHLEDTAQERGMSADDPVLQAEVITLLGSALELGIEFYEANASKAIAIKRLLDISMTACMLLLWIPLIMIISLLIALDSPGPIFYQDQRIGKHGQHFIMYKFRTMTHAPQSGEKNVTHIGRCLRRYSLDEVPQLFNVLKGNMSLTGPRPLSPRDSLQDDSIRSRILLVQPGVCCPSHLIFGFRAVEVAKQVEVDAQYIEHRSLRYDLQLLSRTLRMVMHIKRHSS